MTAHPVFPRVLQILALEDLVRIARVAVDRNRYGDGRPGVAVAELDEALGRFDRLGGFEEFWEDLFFADDLDGDGPDC